MKLIDFENRQNRFIRLNEVSKEYLNQIEQLAKNSSYYPKYHLAPKYGLMNDPNGLCQVDGWYHIFYQWFPLGPVHGLKHWYHLKTRDFLHYEDEGIAMYPDAELDFMGCYTGVATREEGDIVFYYTGVDSNKIQNVCKAKMNVYGNIAEKELCVKQDSSLTTMEFRDPCIFRTNTQTYMIVGGQSLEKKGIVLLYRRIHDSFQYQKNLTIPEELVGYMVECPNFISLEQDVELIIFSPQGVGTKDRETFRNVFSVVYGIGRFDETMEDFVCENYYELDKGFDFYAPQVFRDEQGRILLYAWLGNSKCVYPSDHEQWAHMMTIPRKLSFWEDKIIQCPVEEMKKLRGKSYVLSEEMQLNTRQFELEVDVEQDFCIEIRNPKGEVLCFSGDEQYYCLDRENTTHLYNETYGNQRYAKRDLKRKQRVRMFVDHSAVEIFADEGLMTMTARFYLDDFDTLVLKGCCGTFYEMQGIIIGEK